MGGYIMYCNTKPRKIIIDHRFCFQEDIIGKWVRVSVFEGRACQPPEIIDPLFETRVERGLVEVKVEVQHNGSLENRFEMYDHQYFGYITDPKRVIRKVTRNAFYNLWIVPHVEEGVKSRWRLSTVQDENFLEPDEFGLQTVTGIVHSYTKHSSSFFAWSNSTPKTTIRVEESYCPVNTPMIGRWVEMVINGKYQVQRPIKFIPDVFETYVNSRAAEIRVEFKHFTYSKLHGNLFQNEYFGTITDFDQIVQNVEYGATYSGWIVQDRQNDVPSFFRIVSCQSIISPLKNNDNYSRRSPSPLRFDNKHDVRRPRSPESQGCSSQRGNGRPRFSSPDSRNEYFSRGRSPPRSNRGSTNEDYPPTSHHSFQQRHMSRNDSRASSEVSRGRSPDSQASDNSRRPPKTARRATERSGVSGKSWKPHGDISYYFGPAEKKDDKEEVASKTSSSCAGNSGAAPSGRPQKTTEDERKRRKINTVWFFKNLF
uniref:Uncharacterized protein n=2 Tax=Caenorhabditis japonica TaxID=281687 RepID=A0A8R1IY96_CAEJA